MLSVSLSRPLLVVGSEFRHTHTHTKPHRRRLRSKSIELETHLVCQMKRAKLLSGRVCVLTAGLCALLLAVRAPELGECMCVCER